MAQTTTAAAAAATTMMSRGGTFLVGEYVVVNQIGWGSFSTVWRANHRVHGTEVAIKEIAMARLDDKLQESLKSEIVILKTIDHPNIIRLHDMIEEPGKIYIVLEYCKGGDLSLFIQKRQGRIPEATAKHFMQHLASGLKILRENNLIHRDLKPQNLLLSTNDENSILKIADFGFARSLQPRGLAETFCGSPLYMAPEIMQHQKYDAKADLWSVGTILFQLVTGKTPFTGNTHVQLLQNIVKSTGLQFPPDLKDLSPECIDLCRKLLRCNPVERLTFEEFFNHPFLSQLQTDEILRNRRSQRATAGFPILDINPVRNSEQSSKEVCLPHSQVDDSRGHDGSSSVIRTSPLKITYGFSLDAKADNKQIISSSDKPDLTSKFSSSMHNPEAIGLSDGSHQLLEGKLKESLNPVDCKPVNSCPKEADSLVLVDHDFVLVPFPPVDSLSSVRASALKSSLSTSGSLPPPSGNVKSTSHAPVPSISPAPCKVGFAGSFESHCFAPKTSEVPMDILDTVEQPFMDCMTSPKSLKSLKLYASAITELVIKKIEEEKHLEAFSIQLVILPLWKQTLDIIQAASAVEGSSTQVTPRLRKIVEERGTPDKECPETADVLGLLDICSEIERALLLEIEKAEELAKAIEPGVTKMPDAMEMIYQAAIDLGKDGAVKEYMGNTGSAEVCYSKAVLLLIFLLVEAPSLVLNPPFSLTNSDRDRIHDYINLLNNRQNILRSQRMTLLKCGDQP